ncbi:hypothetical protein [Novosphingobium album (ex Liu et al. 2023)]|uniref:Uncharacterized protein n=1 Tax=Novosphingobium album (ex Liu et al. 2023) TaxID=3031130 RepID=A0ABT5WQY6_9SPHN|nr:hypothetical protein [Novosphingobium album (ex Liu et al. 2023)]MDE8651687.1 hypothetical protein [Novosphingobium album (ex Liu et al. 2023)]
MAEQNRRKSAAKQPISRHPLFPVIVALWFGALFGLGSMMIRPVAIERIVLTLGIDRVIPMAAPPLGGTFRILMAVAMAGLGALIGAVLARRIARPAAQPHERRRSAAPAREVPDDLSSRLAPAPEAEPAVHGRRRALAIDDKAGLLDDLDDRAPLPGSPQILHVAEFDLDGFEQAPTPAVVADDAAAVAADPFDTGNPFAEPPESVEVDDASGEAVWAEPGEPVPFGVARRFEPRPEDAQVFLPLDDDELRDEATDGALSPPFASPRAAGPVTGEGDAAPAAAIADDTGESTAPLNNRLFAAYSREIAARSSAPAPGFTLLPRLGESGWEEDEDDASGLAVAGPAAPLFPATAATHEARPAAVGEGRETPPRERTAAERIAGVDLSELSHVELLERLALSLERRRARMCELAEARAAQAAAVEAVTVDALVDGPVAVGDAADGIGEPDAIVAEPVAAQAPAPEDIAPEDHDDIVASPVPAALRPVALDPIDDEADALPGFVPPRHIALPSALANGLDEDSLEDENRVLEEGYSSLLDLSRGSASRQQFVPGADPAGEDDAQPAASSAEDAAHPAPFARPDAAPQANDRPVDAPETAGQPVSPGDARETERALRAALATLQRMSGAA